MSNTIKTLFTLLFFTICILESRAQKSINTSPLGLQLKQILDNGSTEYKKLKLGKGVPGKYDTLYNSNLKMANTLKSTIKCNDGCLYVILIGDEIEEDAATTIFAQWSNMIAQALGKDFNLESKTKTDDLFVSVQDNFKFEGVFNNTTGTPRKSVTLKMYNYDGSPSNIEIDIRVSGF